MSNNNIYYKEKINKFDQEVSMYGKVINEKAIWLFLATISIVSIEDFLLKFFAYVLIIVIFFYYHSTIKSTKDSFLDSYEKLSKEIKETITDETLRKSFLYDLCIVKDKNISKSIFNIEYLVFFLSILFYIFSILRFFQLASQ